MSIVRAKIIELYGPKFLRKSALNIRGGGGVFERVLKGRGYRTILEIGTYRGCAAAELAQYCDRVITLDLRVGQLERGDEQFDRRQFWSALGVTNIDLHLIDDDVEKARLVNGLDFDLAFIDGAHDLKSVKTDFELTKRCGRVLFHDADDNGPDRPNDVHNFIRALPSEQVEFMDIFALWSVRPDAVPHG
jgi:predicted O-methyltransferase YrrM